VVLAPVAGVKLAEVVWTQPGSIGHQSDSDGEEEFVSGESAP